MLFFGLSPKMLDLASLYVPHCLVLCVRPLCHVWSLLSQEEPLRRGTACKDMDVCTKEVAFCTASYDYTSTWGAPYHCELYVCKSSSSQCLVFLQCVPNTLYCRLLLSHRAPIIVVDLVISTLVVSLLENLATLLQWWPRYWKWWASKCCLKGATSHLPF